MYTGEADGMSTPLFQMMILFPSLYQAEFVIKRSEKKSQRQEMLTNKKTLLSTSNLIFNWLQILVWNYVKPKMKFTVNWS